MKVNDRISTRDALTEELEKFVPFNEQEQKDKEFFLKLIHKYDDIYTRENDMAHFSFSAFVVNKDRSKMLMVYHNIFDGWIYPGGHADGTFNFISKAIEEVQEETGIEEVKLLHDGLFSIQSNPNIGHIKRGKYISAHIHLDTIVLLEVDDKLPLRIQPDENSQVAWMPVEDAESKKVVDFARPTCAKIMKKIK